uniref:Polysaccharide biosynthesis domain containing 1 n=2 Tax=Crocodylus porosus TaxID=8502 RepID=A0A7M4FS23_CROPO
MRRRSHPHHGTPVQAASGAAGSEPPEQAGQRSGVPGNMAAAGGGLGALGPGGAAAAARALSLPAEAYGNDPGVEMMWAMKAAQHAEVYFNLISSVDPTFLKLTKVDEEIYTAFRDRFRHLRIDVLEPEELKSEPAKEKWRPFCMQFEGVVEDFNYGTLLRLDCSKDYTEENTIFATRIQFFAIEIARNREGYNSVIYNSATQRKMAAAEKAACEHG